MDLSELIIFFLIFEDFYRVVQYLHFKIWGELKPPSPSVAPPMVLVFFKNL